MNSVSLEEVIKILEADKAYRLSISPKGKFYFEEAKEKTRLCKVINKTILKNNKIQLNLHDGTNLIFNEKGKVSIGDSIELDFNNNKKRIIPLEKGKDVLIISGKSQGLSGKVEDIKLKKAKIKLHEIDREVELGIGHITVR